MQESSAALDNSAVMIGMFNEGFLSIYLKS
jgi:hypothetical protein